jgi:hypothetical protein
VCNVYLTGVPPQIGIMRNINYCSQCVGVCYQVIHDICVGYVSHLAMTRIIRYIAMACMALMLSRYGYPSSSLFYLYIIINSHAQAFLTTSHYSGVYMKPSEHGCRWNVVMHLAFIAVVYWQTAPCDVGVHVISIIPTGLMY